MTTPQELLAEEGFTIKEVYSGVDINTDVVEMELAKNYGFLLAVGSINVLFGIMALFAPIAASMVILGFLSFTMILLGVVNMGEGFSVKYHRGPAVVGGFILVVLGFLMVTNAVSSLMVMTVAVALMYLCAGIYRAFLARKNPDMQGSKAVLISGIVAIIVSVIIIATIPFSSRITLGLLLGFNWIAYGGQRIALGLIGRETANRALETVRANSDDYASAP